jgi:tetratricopeptide (TPR) repeat protein
MPSLDQLLPLLEADPEDSFLRYGVAMEYSKLGRYDDALREFGELLRKSPDYVAGYFMAGRTSEQKGDPEEAKRYYREGITVAKRTGDTHAAGEISAALMMLE